MLNYNEFLNEINFNLIPFDDYTIFTINKNGRLIDEYSFIANSGIKYSVYFMLTSEDDEKLTRGGNLSDYTDLDKIPTIFFSLTERGFGDNFNDITSRNEFLEVMGKVVHIILQYMNSHDYTVYSVGGVGDKKIQFYNNYRKYFTEYRPVISVSKNYSPDGSKTNAFYLVKNFKDNIQNVDRIKLDENCYINFI